jgi:hypothetical protein
LFKIILFLALALGAALYFPKTRPIVLDFVAPALNPLLTWQTKGEMEQIARELQGMNREGQLLPEVGEEFADWVGRHFQGGSSMDGWGVPYTLRVWPDSVGVVSNGPDLTMGTADDLVQTAHIQRQRQRRR